MNVGMMNGILLNFKKTTFPKRFLFGLYEKILYQITVIFELQVGIFSIIVELLKG